jgi:hypothetical protein
LQNIMVEVEVVGTFHLRAEDNWRTDGLSRGLSLSDLAARDVNLLNVPFIDLRASDVLQLCDPRLIINNDDDFTQFWRRTKSVIDSNL